MAPGKARGIPSDWHGVTRRCLAAAALASATLAPLPGVAAETFQADQWRTECDGTGPSAQCSIMVPFHERSSRGVAGSFVLAIGVDSGVAAIVGKPAPLAATLQVDKNPRIGCTGPGYCVFAPGGALAAAGQLAAGSLVLIDVMTKDGSYHSSLTTQGYRAGLAKLRAWSFPAILPRRPTR